MNPIFNLHASVYLTAIGMPSPKPERSGHEDVIRRDVTIESNSLLTRARAGLRAFLNSLKPTEGQVRPGFYADRWLGP